MVFGVQKTDISGRVDGEILVAIGAVAVGSLVVSGSVVVVGNSIHWLEQQGFVMTVSPKKQLMDLFLV